MKYRILLSAAVIISALVFGVTPALADEPPVCNDPPCVYVDPDPARNPPGNEDGTRDYPYSTQNEGLAFARAQGVDTILYIKNSSGQWIPTLVRPVTSGTTGLPFSETTLYALVATLALVLILAGWLLQRRSHALQRGLGKS
ncbi:MAG TPA: hypothetical protein VI524_07360 [Anaerolineales bacterium]|nr:hypothetical protein [Anaerolineales bacterium]